MSRNERITYLSSFNMHLLQPQIVEPTSKMRKQAGKQSGKQTKKAAPGTVSASKPNGGNKASKARRSAMALAAPLLDTADGTATISDVAESGVSGVSPTKRARPGRENKNRKNAKANTGRYSSNIQDDVGNSDKVRKNERGAPEVKESNQAVSNRAALVTSEILQVDTFVHVKSEIQQAEYLEKLKHDQLRQQQEQEQHQRQLQQLQRHVQPGYERADSSVNQHLSNHHQHHHQHEHKEQQQQVLYHYQDQESTLVDSIQVSAQEGSSLVHNIQTTFHSESSPSQRPGSVPETEQSRSPLSLNRHNQNPHQQQQHQDHQYPPLSLSSQPQQEYQHYQQHDSFPQEQHQQQNNLEHHLHPHQTLMHASALENDNKDSPPPLLIPQSSYVSTTSHPVLMSGSTTTHLIQTVGHDEAGGLVYTHQPQQDHHHHQHIHAHHQLFYEGGIPQQRSDSGDISDIHAQVQLQPPVAHSRGEGNHLQHGLGNSHNRISTIHIPASSLTGLNNQQASGNIQVLDSESPGPAHMPTIDHQQMAQQLAEMAHPHQTFTMLTNVSSLGGAPSPGIGSNKRGGKSTSQILCSDFLVKFNISTHLDLMPETGDYVAWGSYIAMKKTYKNLHSSITFFPFYYSFESLAFYVF